MSATHGKAQRNELNLHLDSAGHRFGATAHGGSHFGRRRKVLKCCTKMRMRALKYCKVDTFERVDFEQA